MRPASVRMPPSPSLSARSTNVQYLSEMTRMSAQKMSDRMPSTFSGLQRQVVPVEALAQRVERARADVAVDDPERAERERQLQPLGAGPVRVVLRGPRNVGARHHRRRFRHRRRSGVGRRAGGRGRGFFGHRKNSQRRKPRGSSNAAGCLESKPHAGPIPRPRVPMSPRRRVGGQAPLELHAFAELDHAPGGQAVVVGHIG